MHIVLSFILCFCFALSVNAQEKQPIEGKVGELGLSFLKEQSGVETIGMAYYKTAGVQPDFREWAKKTNKVIETPAYDRDLVETTEFNRLQNKFANFEPDTPIIVHAAVDLERYSERQEVLFMPYFYPELYFPYDVYGMPLAVLAQNIVDFKEVSLPGEQAEVIFSKMDGDTQALVEVTLMPVLADHERTLPLDGTEFHPLLTKVVQLAMWRQKDPIPVWVWRDPSYQPKQNKELINLYKK